MTKKEMIREIATVTGFKQVDIGAVVEAMENITINQVKNRDELKIFNGLTLYGSCKEANTARNPLTGEAVFVPEKTVLRAKVGQRFKKLINE